MQRNPLSRRSVLSLAGACVAAGAGATTVSGAQENGSTRESFVIREGTAEETTVYVTTADADGPTAVVIGGVHGNEVAGYTAASAIADWEIGAGTLVTVPEANAAAIDRSTRTADDGADLNRQFPEGERPRTDLARALWRVITEYDPDIVIDLHESTGIYANDPVDGVGQAIFHSDEATAAATDAAEYVTRNYVDDSSLAFQTGPFTGPDTDPTGLLVHKAARDLGADAFLAETLSTNVSLETRVQWHSAIVERLLTDELQLEAVEGGDSDESDTDGEEADGDEEAEEGETAEEAEEGETAEEAEEGETAEEAEEGETAEEAEEGETAEEAEEGETAEETDEGETAEETDEGETAEETDEGETDEAETDEAESADEDETTTETPVTSSDSCPANAAR
ncbi:succinylglutamate desuccinylase/aspartoacylase family protein [Haloterrigena salinisoli]|uniref:succinylglutamate desuccinylase/aspartoacylase family protein n=1 Tax=Haloterrigena salinisoli TaxID=3132747 RepID=UPI0030D1C29B